MSVELFEGEFVSLPMFSSTQIEIQLLGYLFK